MVENINHNLEQLNAMNSLIQAYLQKKITLNYLVNNLETLQYSLKNISQDFVDQFISLWGILEEHYAWMLDQKRNYLISQEEVRIKEVLAELQTLVEKYKNNLKK